MPKRRIRRHYFLPMSDKVQEAIDNFMSNLKDIADLHRPTDEKRLFIIALEAVKANAPIPYEQMRVTYEKTISSQNLNKDFFDEFYKTYIEVVRIAFNVLSLINKKSPFENSFRF